MFQFGFMIFFPHEKFMLLSSLKTNCSRVAVPSLINPPPFFYS